MYGRINKYRNKSDPTIGFPDRIDNFGVRHYENRSRLPFDDMTSIAKNTIKMSAITFTTLGYSYYRTIELLFSRGISTSFLLLNPDSQFVAVQSRQFSQARNLKSQIIDSLESFRDLQKKYLKLVSTGTYNDLAAYSITIIYDEYIKVEDHPAGSDAGSRPNHAAFRKSSPAFYDLYSLEYDELEARFQIY